MTNHKRSLWDDLVDIGNQILDKIDEALNPENKRRKPARVPVPIRPNYPPRHDQYDQR